MTNNGWLSETTLGGKNKTFWWKFDDENNIHIKRRFNFKNGEKELTKIAITHELDKLDDYMKDVSWKYIANNVEKLALGTEKAGIGMFLYNQLNWSGTEAQLSGHLGVIFYKAGVWDYNGKKRGIQHRRISDNWKKLVRNYYEKRSNLI